MHLDVVDEVGEVAGPPATVEVGHEGRPADRAEDEVVAAEDHVPLGVPGVEPELGRGLGDERLDLAVVEPDRAPARGRPGAGRRERVERPVAEAPRSRSRARIRSEARWIASTWSALRISTGRNGLTIVRQGSWAIPPATRRGRRRGLSVIVEGSRSVASSAGSSPRSSARVSPRSSSSPAGLVVTWLGPPVRSGDGPSRGSGMRLRPLPSTSSEGPWNPPRRVPRN